MVRAWSCACGGSIYRSEPKPKPVSNGAWKVWDGRGWIGRVGWIEGMRERIRGRLGEGVDGILLRGPGRRYMSGMEEIVSVGGTVRESLGVGRTSRGWARVGCPYFARV